MSVTPFLFAAPYPVTIFLTLEGAYSAIGMPYFSAERRITPRACAIARAALLFLAT